MGLVSYGGGHSYMTHLYALIKLAHEKGLKKIYVHAFLDGRDVPPKTALGDIKELDAFCKENWNVKIATVSGRYYTMDRDNRWDRTKLVFEILTTGIAALRAPNAETAVSEAYSRDETDEFVKPTLISDSEGKPEAIIKDNDSVIFFNFRSDRARQLTWAFVNENFDDSARESVRMFTMSAWYSTMKPWICPLLSPQDELANVLGKVLSEQGLIQLRIAETEKYAHVTFFRNGGQEKCYTGEDRCLIPSPKIATYDLKPEIERI